MYELEALSVQNVRTLLDRATAAGECEPAGEIDTAALEFLAERSGGDARTALAAAVGAGSPLVDAADERADRVIRFHEHFHRLGFFTVDGRFAGTALRDVEVPPDHLVGPLAVHLEVVSSCNLTCTHCFAGELPRREKRLGPAEIDRLFAEMARLGSFRLGLTGGEPLLRKDLFDILDAAVGRNLHPCLTTNALLLTEEIARQLGRRDLVWLNVSLEGPDAGTNDAVRGAGTFAAVLDRLAVLRRQARFTLAFTIMRNTCANRQLVLFK